MLTKKTKVKDDLSKLTALKMRGWDIANGRDQGETVHVPICCCWIEEGRKEGGGRERLIESKMVEQIFVLRG